MLRWAGEAVRSDHEMVLTAVQKHGLALQWAPEEMRSDHDIVLAAVTDRGEALQYADESLRDVEDVVLASVSEWGQSLRWAPRRLREDLAVVTAAVQDDIWAFNCATERGRTLPEVIEYVKTVIQAESLSFHFFLQIGLLSGRSSTTLWPAPADRYGVMAVAGRELELGVPVDQLVLMQGTEIVEMMTEVVPDDLVFLSLVVTAPV